MRLPNLSPSIDRRIPGSAPAGPGRGAVRPQQLPTCQGECGPNNPCLNPNQCECNSSGQCVPIQGQGPTGPQVRAGGHSQHT
jgi:hypothetical protein